MFEGITEGTYPDKDEKNPSIGEEELESVDSELQSSYCVLKNCGIIDTPEGFKELCKSESVERVIPFAKERNLEYVTRLYKADTPEKFEEMCKNESAGGIIQYAEEKKLEYVTQLYKIDTPEKLEKMWEKKSIRNIVKYAKERNLEYVTQLYRVDTPEKLEEMCKKDHIEHIVEYADEKTLEYVTELYRIDTPEEFEEMCENKSVLDVINHANGKNLEYVTELYRVDKPQEFEEMCENKSVADAIAYANEKNLEYAISLCGDIREFEKICENRSVTDVIKYTNEKNLEYATKLYKIDTPEGLGKMCENEKVMEVIRYANEKNLEYATKLYEIDTPEELGKMCENEKVMEVIRYANEKNLERTTRLYKVDTPEGLGKMCENESVVEVIRYANEKNFERTTELYEIDTPEGLGKMCENENVRDVLKDATEENLERVTGLCGNIQEFEKLCEKENVRNVLRFAKEENLEYAIDSKLVNANSISRIDIDQIDLLDVVDTKRQNEVETEFLRKLFNNYPNSVVNTLETISEDKNISIETDQSDIFDMLDEMGGISPLMFSGFKKLNREGKKEYAEKIKKAKKEMFKNKPVDMADFPEEKAELISMAYKPLGMSFIEVRDFASRLEDRTEDLKDYIFPEDGYDIKIENGHEKIVREGNAIDHDAIDNLKSIIKKAEEKKAHLEKNSKGISVALDKIIKASPTLGDEDLVNLISLLDNAGISSFAAKEPSSSDIKNLYGYLSEFKEILGVVFKDNFEGNLKRFLEGNDEMPERIIEKLSKEQTKNAFIKAIKKDLNPNDEILSDEYWKNLDLDKACRLLSVFVEKKIIKRERGKISKELNKIEYADRENSKTSRVQKQEVNLKAYISKNIGSFFAKASAGICSAEDIELFNRSDHFHINLAERDKNNNEVIRGNVQAYIIEEEGGRSLLLRGINPNSDFLYEIDAKVLCEEIIKVAKRFKGDNDLKNVYLSEQLKEWHALSNRAEVYDYLKRYIKAENEKEYAFDIAEDIAISKMYKIG